MFATVALAKRIEEAERLLVVALAGVVGARGGDVSVVNVGAGAVVYGGEGAPFNKAIAIGFEPLDEEALLCAEAEHDARGAPLRFEIATLSDPPVFEALSRRGYTLVGFENVLGLPLGSGQEHRADDGIEVGLARPDEYDAWTRVVTTGFASPDGSAPETESHPPEALLAVFRDFAGVAELERTLARRDGELAGGASLFTFGDIAVMAGAATLLAHRRHGVQRALLRARLARAARSGCSLAVVTTQPGSQSQSNVQRAGFSLLYARAILVRAQRSGR